jgi:hypothetical protein
LGLGKELVLELALELVLELAKGLVLEWLGVSLLFLSSYYRQVTPTSLA